MSYVVLARKYRPRSFSQMVGQEHVVQALTNALKQQRLHHAYLFTGTRGIGKTTVSRILAKSLNCTGPDGSGGITDQPCGVCQACTEIDADRYIDYIELDAASNRGIDEVRELLERAAYKPSVGRFKVFMIDEAHQLTKESFNALLKTLEEPPEYLKFVLATTDPQKMLPTVLSRCLQFNLRPMPPEVVREHLQNVLQAEQVQSDEGSLRLLARAARGSMRDALSLTDQAIAYGGGRLDEGVVRTMLGTVDRSHATRIVQALAQRDGAALLEAVQGLRSMGLSAAGTLEEMATLLQQMAVEQAVPGALDEHDPDTVQVRALAAQLPGDETQLLYSIVLQGRGELTLASDEYAALTMVLLRLLAFPKADAPLAAAKQSAPLDMGRAPRQAVAPRPVAAAPAVRPASPPTSSVSRQVAPAQRPPVPPSYRPSPPQPPLRTSAAPAPSVNEPPPWLDDVPPADDIGASAVATLERPATRVVAAEPTTVRLQAAAAPVPTAPDGVPEAESEHDSAAPAWEVQRTELGDRWADVVAQLNERSAIVALVRELAQQAELVRAEGSQWLLRVERETLRAQPLRDKLQAALATVVAPAPQLEVEAGVAQDSPARRDAAERERRQREAERIIRNDPLVQELMNQFRTARIVPGSIKPV
jgi:DNA polymerase-3 subunit gamma/tau